MRLLNKEFTNLLMFGPMIGELKKEQMRGLILHQFRQQPEIFNLNRIVLTYAIQILAETDNQQQNDWHEITKKLYLNRCSISNEGISYLAINPWHNLQELQLRNNRLNWIGAREFAKGKWDRLVTLDLCKQSIDKANNDLENQGLKQLTKSDLPSLDSLDISWNIINDSSFLHDISLWSMNFPCLSQLYLRNNNFSLISTSRALGLCCIDTLRYLDIKNPAGGAKQIIVSVLHPEMYNLKLDLIARELEWESFDDDEQQQ